MRPRRRADRRGMTAAVCAVVVFAAIQCAVEIFADRRPWLVEPSYGPRLKVLRQRVGAEPSAFTLVFLGTSRIESGVRAERIEPHLSRAMGRPVICMNFAAPGAGHAFALMNLRRLLYDGIRPDAAVVEVHPSVLTGNHLGDFGPSRELLLMRRVDWETVDRHSGLPWFERWSARAELPLHRYRSALLHAIWPTMMPLSVRSWFDRTFNESGTMYESRYPLREVDLSSQREGVARLWRDMLPGIVMDAGASPALLELLELCRGQRIRVALLIPPEAESLRALYPPDLRGRMHKFLRDVSIGDVVVLDSFEDGLEADFFDGHHHWLEGARRATDSLTRKHLFPWLVPGAPLPPPPQP